MIKVGDILLDKNNKQWLLFDFMGQNNELYCVVDFKTNKEGYVLELKDIQSYESKPSNVEHVFIKRRERTHLNLFGALPY